MQTASFHASLNRECKMWQARMLVQACRTNLYFTNIRHRQWVDFPMKVSSEQTPQFFCCLPTTCLIRGPISAWAWEPMPWGTRLMIPTELTWWVYILGPALGKHHWAAPRITGAAGVEAYRNPANWLMTYILETNIPLELQEEIMTISYGRCKNGYCTPNSEVGYPWVAPACLCPEFSLCALYSQRQCPDDN